MWRKDMKKAFVVVLAAVLLITTVLTGCGGTKVTAYTESSQAINVNLNQDFTIALQANPTTGYDWQPVFDAGLLSQVKKDYQQDDHSGKQLVGSGGTDFFTFKGLKAGETKITFTYYRPWETPKAEDKQQVFNIVIK
jgi:inhibitor of cysteine peptidase